MNNRAFDIYNDIIKEWWEFVCPSQIMYFKKVSKYTARKVINIFRDKNMVKYELIIYKWCNWNCTNENSPYCECWPPPPPMGVWKIIK